VSEVLLSEDGDEAEGEEELQEAQHLLHGGRELQEGASDRLSELLLQHSSTQHRLLLLLLQKVRGHTGQDTRGSPGGQEEVLEENLQDEGGAELSGQKVH